MTPRSTGRTTGLTGAVVLADADILGMESPEPFSAASPEPNTVAFEIPGTLKIVLNEQVRSADGSQINVNAVHITVSDPATGAVIQDVVLASTQCSLRAVPPPPPPPPAPVPPAPVPEPQTEVRGKVTTMDKCGRAGDVFRAKRVRGVTHRVKGDVIREGVWLRAKTRTVRVRAVASSDRYVVVGKEVFTLRFTDKPCATPPEVLPATGV